MRVALVHDYLKEYGGAERVLEALHELFPKAPVFTLVYLPDFLGPHKSRFNSWEIKTSVAQHLPYKNKLISPLRILAPFLFKSFDFSNYDVIIVSATGAYNPTILDKKKAKIVCYCHTPPRYLYGYATARNLTNDPILKVFAGIANHILRMVDFKASENVDYYIANSEEVKGRIKKFYKKDAVVIYPPIDLPLVNVNSRKSNYFVTGGRLARAKHIDIIVKACSELNLPLKVFGKSFAGYGEELQSLAKNNVEFLGEVTDEEKWELLKEAKGFLFASEDEDFGIVPVEAMAAGTPVIAYRSGGVKESIKEGKTGMFFDELTPQSLMAVIKEFETKKFYPEECKKHASLFSKERFLKEFSSFVSKIN
jgi:glycosyltransferase involved in cell wall biosynthesis